MLIPKSPVRTKGKGLARGDGIHHHRGTTHLRRRCHLLAQQGSGSELRVMLQLRTSENASNVKSLLQNRWLSQGRQAVHVLHNSKHASGCSADANMLIFDYAVSSIIVLNCHFYACARRDWDGSERRERGRVNARKRAEWGSGNGAE